MAATRGKIGLRWAITAGVVMLLGALLGLSISLMRSPLPHEAEPVVKSLPPAPEPEVPAFLEAEEEDVEVVHKTQNEVMAWLDSQEGQEGDWPPPGAMTMPEVLEGETTDQENDRAEALLEELRASLREESSTPPAAEPPPPPSTSAEEDASQGRASVTPASEPVEGASEAAPEQEAAPTAKVPSEPAPKQEVAPAAEVPFAYTIHLESFRNPQIAQSRKQQIEKLGLEAFTLEVDLPEKGVFHRVFVGRFPERGQAKALQGRLEKDYDLPGGRIMAASEINR